MLNTACPICSEVRETMERYPDSVCQDCCNTGIFADPSQTTTINFGNTDYNGGFQSCINGVVGNQHICYIKGHQCFANEARFGGIVISYTDEAQDKNNILKRKYPKEYDYYLRSQKRKNTNSTLVQEITVAPTIEVMER